MSIKKHDSPGASRRDNILDAAESLFAEKGVDAVSVRNIANAANVKLSLVTYHFPSKDMLFSKVLERRSGALASMRLQLLETSRGSDGFELMQLIECYTRPMLDIALKEDVGWRNYAHLAARVAQSHKYSEIVSDLYDEAANQFVESLLKLFPNASRESAFRATVYLVSVMLGVFSSNRRVETLSDGEFTSTPEIAYRSMCKFIEGGIRSMMSE